MPKEFVCDYLGGPPILATDIERVYHCNAEYSRAPEPRKGMPCDKGEAHYDTFCNLCRVKKPTITKVE